jgi:hypothetical protein
LEEVQEKVNINAQGKGSCHSSKNPSKVCHRLQPDTLRARRPMRATPSNLGPRRGTNEVLRLCHHLHHPKEQALHPGCEIRQAGRGAHRCHRLPLSRGINVGSKSEEPVLGTGNSTTSR